MCDACIECNLQHEVDKVQEVIKHVCNANTTEMSETL